MYDIRAFFTSLAVIVIHRKPYTAVFPCPALGDPQTLHVYASSQLLIIVTGLDNTGIQYWKYN